MTQEVIDQIKQAADIIGSTFGPAGKNVMFKSRENLPAAMIRDGVKTARRLAACEPLNTGFQLLVDACMSTVRKTGDGTTTTAILVKALLENWSEVNLENYMVKGQTATKEQFYQAAGISARMIGETVGLIVTVVFSQLYHPFMTKSSKPCFPVSSFSSLIETGPRRVICFAVKSAIIFLLISLSFDN